jgi:hypothetical protein
VTSPVQDWTLVAKSKTAFPYRDRWIRTADLKNSAEDIPNTTTRPLKDNGTLHLVETILLSIEGKERLQVLTRGNGQKGVHSYINSVAFCPQAKYTDRATPACRRS